MILYIVQGLLGASALALASYLILRLIFRDALVVTLVDAPLPYLILAALVLLLVSLLLQWWWLSILLAPAAVAFVVWYGPGFIPRHVRPAATEALTLSALTFNLQSAQNAPDGLVCVIREAAADIVALQELGQEVAEALQDELSDLYPGQVLHPGAKTEEIWEASGVLSRYPIVQEEMWKTHFGHQRLELDVAGTRVVFYNTHPAPPLSLDRAAQRREDIQLIMDRAARETAPVIIAGDFNMTPLAEDYRRMTAIYHDSYQEAGYGFGFTFEPFSNPFPLTRLDHIFYGEGARAVESRVWPDSGGSDHRPVRAVLVLENEGQ